MASFFDNKARASAAAASSSKSKPDSSSNSALAPRLQPWVEKYRPKNLSEVKSQDHVSSILKKMVHAANLPHLLLYGPPGTGKTSTILALCRELFPPEIFASRVLELNASDERGITVVREKIKGFAAQTVSTAPKGSKYPCPPFKIIILDEADSLTQDSQSALRRTMEIYSKTCRIALCCNYVTRIIDPISSRCSKFRFKPLDGVDAKARISEILAAEGVEVEDDSVVDRTLKLCEGDLRKALQLLQSAARLVGVISPSISTNTTTNGNKSKRVVDDDDDDEDEEMPDAGAIPTDPTTAITTTKPKTKKITTAIIDEIAGVIPPNEVDSLLQVLRKGNKMNFTPIHTKLEDILASGWAATEMLTALYQKLIMDDDAGIFVSGGKGDVTVGGKKKNKLTLIFSEMDKRLGDGVDESLLLHDLCLRIAGILAAK